MKWLHAITISAMLLMALMATQVFAQDRIVPIHKKDLDIRVWTNKTEGKSFGQGEHIIIYFQANRDCYVTIYNLDTRGNINLLFPIEDSEPNYVEGGRIYTIPDYYDDFDLVVDGPPGTEYIQAVASLDWYEVPPWPSRFYEYEDYRPLQSDREPVAFLNYVNNRYFPLNDRRRYATDYTYFEIRKNWEYDWNDYYGYDANYYSGYYDPWGWCGTIYVGYPYGGEVWINGIFYGYAPLFIPRIVIGWHRIGIWYNDFWWYDSRVHIYSGVWYDYTYDNVRYKDDYRHYKFKPGRRASHDVVSDKYYPDRRTKVYTSEKKYVSRDKYWKTIGKQRVSSSTSPYFKKKGDRGGKKYSPDSRTIVKGRDNWSGSKSGKKRDRFGVQKRTVNSDKSRKHGSAGKLDSPKSSKYSGGKKVKKSSGLKRSGSGKTSGPIFKSGKGTKKSSGSTKIKSGGSKKSSGSSKGKSGGSKKIKSNGAKKSGSRSSSGYSAPRKTSVRTSGGSINRGGSRSSGSKGSSGGRKGKRR